MASTRRNNKQSSPDGAELPDNMEEQRGEVSMMALRCVGTSPLLVHQWGKKSVIEMLAKMTGHDLTRLPKDLKEDYEESSYKNERGEHVMPCRIIKKVGVAGAISAGGAISKAALNRGLRIMGHTAPIKNSKPQMDVRITRTSGMNKTPDVRARALYPDGWTIDFVVRFYPKMIAPQKIVHVFRLAGEDIGFCEMRLEKGFSYGAFEVESVPEARIPAILKECASLERLFQIPDALLRAAGASGNAAARKAAAVVRGVNGAAARHASSVS
jgi:hypothetical protein